MKQQLSILLEADSIVNGEEQANRKYGPPEIVFQEYADIFHMIAPKDCFDEDGGINALGIAYVAKSVKLGREKNHHKRDNLIDDVGYTDIIDRIRDRK